MHAAGKMEGTVHSIVRVEVDIVSLLLNISTYLLIATFFSEFIYFHPVIVIGGSSKFIWQSGYTCHFGIPI